MKSVSYFKVTIGYLLGITKMNDKNKIEDFEILLLCSNHDSKFIREILDRVGDKWTVLVLVKLIKSENYRARFSELKKNIPNISQRMLTSTLRNLERDGYIIREVFPEVPPRVEYELKELGKSLISTLLVFSEWITENQDYIKESRIKYDSISK